MTLRATHTDLDDGPAPDYNLDNGHTLTFRAFDSDDFVFDHDDQDNTDEAINAMSVVNMGGETAIDEQYVEVVWNSPDNRRLRYTVGVSKYDYYRYGEGYFIHPSATIDGMGSDPGISTTDVKNTGVFAGLFLDVTDNLTVSLEARQQEDDISSNDPDPNDDNVPRSVSETFLPRLALNYAVSDRLNLYAQFAEGVQPATINVQAVGTQQRAIAAAFEGLVVDGVTYSSQVPFLDDVLAVDEEVLTNYEVGLKGTFLDGRLNLGAALFRIEKAWARRGDVGHDAEQTHVTIAGAPSITKRRTHSSEEKGTAS